MKLSSLVVAAIAAITFPVVHADHDEAFSWGKLAVTLPKPLSDHSASLATSNGLIYIAGGCDSPNGNEFAGDFFFCASISDQMYVFNPTDASFGEPKTLPRPRYRHCAAVVNNQLWLLGGRSAEDGLIAQVDVYDIVSESWSTFALSEEYQTSDHACFTDGSTSLYAVGGYDATYTTKATNIRINTSDAASPLVVEEMAPLIEARGDIFAAFDASFAYLGGGFTDANEFCAPLATAEKYEFSTNTWTNLPPLPNERGEIVMVASGGHIYAMGGERQIDGICDLTGTTDPGELTVGSELVESLEGDQWNLIESFDDHKFRFAAVDVDGIIYAFGGQDAWDDDCECFKTTSEIQILGDGVTSAPTMASGHVVSSFATLASAFLLGVVGVMM
jgi:hypothetical protein